MFVAVGERKRHGGFPNRHGNRGKQMNRSREKLQNMLIILADLVCLLVSYVLAGYIWLGGIKGAANSALRDDLYGDIGAILLAYAITILMFNFTNDFLRRGKLVEFGQIARENLIIAALMTVIIFFKHENSDISRGVYVLMFIVNIALEEIVHGVVKKYLVGYYSNSRSSSQLYVVTTYDRAAKVIADMQTNAVWGSTISSLCIVDKDIRGQMINGIQVSAGYNDMIDFAKSQIVDEVFIDVPYDTGSSLISIVTEFENMGATVHLNIEVMERFPTFSKTLGMLGSIPVITFANNEYDYRQLFLKRCMDIIGSAIGLVITAVAFVFVAPAIKLESPGPLFFKQKRVGRNGRYFYIYKFRSMYVDAEERKKELMADNKMEGFMFKMDNDPRITRVGRFIRKTSIDELPQFWNVLRGDMSLVGTRPPTVEEFKQYRTYHKRRLSMKPGITGLWQVSGRNSITDFEDVVRLDLRYIDNWNIALDIKILFKTVAVVFKGE
jgi:exopolysaccharide biosynthesis polyprenyl glycosylphosphotransferase